MYLDLPLPSVNNVPIQLRQCYSCTARSIGCGEFLNPRHASKYIRPCVSSCVIFRNPNDHDCAYINDVLFFNVHFSTIR